MKRYQLVPLILVLSLSGCGSSKKKSGENQAPLKYGVFLGCDSSSLSKIKKYPNVAIDLDNFSSSAISSLKENECTIYAYLSVGSLEKYRSYYETYKDLTFMDYENWPDERWVDVSDSSWQSHILDEANRLKGLGADGIFMDNFDVYYIAAEEYQGSDINKEDIYQGCLKMLNDLSSAGMKLMINSGTDFLDRMHSENRNEINKINVYAQETVFSKIEDYQNNVFGRQDAGEKEYLLSIVEFMRYKGDVLFIEYTNDATLKKEIQEYCDELNYHYYISENIELKI